MDINQLVDKARNSIAKFCIGECNAYCCRKGYIVLSEEEMHLIAGNKEKEMEENSNLDKIDDCQFLLNLNIGCPKLIDSKCTIHANPKRNTVCKEFPLFIEGNSIRFSIRCPAVQKGLFYSYEHQFIKKGYKLNKIEN
ncbi:MAG: YkgJ family cysteine cluster protein [Nanoarchaeota archaeon]|nr:YkgJ family cysteine cluster protein [Nanoarchaeota archaeon]